MATVEVVVFVHASHLGEEFSFLVLNRPGAHIS